MPLIVYTGAPKGPRLRSVQGLPKECCFFGHLSWSVRELLREVFLTLSGFSWCHKSFAHSCCQVQVAKNTPRVSRGKGSRFVGGTRLVVFPRPNRPQFEKATSPERGPLALPPSQRGAGRGGTSRKGGPGSKGGRGPGSWCSSACTGSRSVGIPPTSRDPSHFPTEQSSLGHFYQDRTHHRNTKPHQGQKVLLLNPLSSELGGFLPGKGRRLSVIPWLPNKVRQPARFHIAMVGPPVIFPPLTRL